MDRTSVAVVECRLTFRSHFGQLRLPSDPALLLNSNHEVSASPSALDSGILLLKIVSALLLSAITNEKGFRCRVVITVDVTVTVLIPVHVLAFIIFIGS